ncbi:MAG: hypothetical protein FJ011_09245 [Chloroflexi bacterium]|nr:hypothetical protein [Chloroflexota bacterium]
MGITIFYHSRLRNLAELPQLTAELPAACVRLGWPCHPVDERILGTAERYNIVPVECDDGIPTDTFEFYEVPVDDHVRGVVIHPPGCETLFLTFGRTGQTVRYEDLPFAESKPGRYGPILDHLWCKTQFSSPETHVQVCELLRIAEKYTAEWEVTDEGDYWQTGDFELLRATWARHQGILDAFRDPKAAQTLVNLANVDIQVARPPEVGKFISRLAPLWRREWGVSAAEN